MKKYKPTPEEIRQVVRGFMSLSDIDKLTISKKIGYIQPKIGGSMTIQERDKQFFLWVKVEKKLELLMDIIKYGETNI